MLHDQGRFLDDRWNWIRGVVGGAGVAGLGAADMVGVVANGIANNNTIGANAAAAAAAPPAAAGGSGGGSIINANAAAAAAAPPAAAGGSGGGSILNANAAAAAAAPPAAAGGGSLTYEHVMFMIRNHVQFNDAIELFQHKVTRQPMTLHSLRTLPPGRWLNDEVINFSCTLMQVWQANSMHMSNTQVQAPHQRPCHFRPTLQDKKGGVRQTRQTLKVYLHNTFFYNKLYKVLRQACCMARRACAVL
jgi:hypothetical protein